MKTLGKLSAVMLALTALTGIAVMVRSIPDIVRYVKISRM
ncbi:DUF6893 family small protein [Arthrobacter terrae]